MQRRSYLIGTVSLLIVTAVAVGQSGAPVSGATGQARAASSMDNGPDAAANKALVLKFFKMAFTDHRVAEAFALYTSDNFIEHSPGMNGRSGAIRALSKMFAPGAGLTATVQRAVAQGDIVSVHFDGGVDIFRVKNGKIVEHWDG